MILYNDNIIDIFISENFVIDSQVDMYDNYMLKITIKSFYKMFILNNML